MIHLCADTPKCYESDAFLCDWRRFRAQSSFKRSMCVHRWRCHFPWNRKFLHIRRFDGNCRAYNIYHLHAKEERDPLD